MPKIIGLEEIKPGSWGPIYTIQSIWVNFKGGRDVTKEIVASIASASQSLARDYSSKN